MAINMNIDKKSLLNLKQLMTLNTDNRSNYYSDCIQINDDQ